MGRIYVARKKSKNPVLSKKKNVQKYKIGKIQNRPPVCGNRPAWLMEEFV